MNEPAQLKDPATILLVEDREDVRTPLGHYLRRVGYSVFLAGDATRALSFAKAPDTRIDVLLTDVNLPGIGGLELAGAIRLLHPGASVVIMSGSLPEDALPERLCELGATFLPKPFRMEELVALMPRR